MAATRTLEELRDALRAFASARDWDQFHSPKNLAMALTVEAGELLEAFLWLTDEQSNNLAADARGNAGEEVADILIYLVRLADKLGIDLLEAAAQKLQKNELKYPVELSRGNALKYTRLRTSQEGES